jgi:hypothetical protein
MLQKFWKPKVNSKNYSRNRCNNGVEQLVGGNSGTSYVPEHIRSIITCSIYEIHVICAMVKILLFVASVDEPSGHTFGGTTVVGL